LFSHPFGGTHDAAGVGGFVGGDHRELTSAISCGGRCERPGAEDVVSDCGNGILFHQRDVLEGSGVEDLCGAIFLKDSGEKRRIVDVAENWDVLLRVRR